MSRLSKTLGMIRFEHSVFALPFAMAGAWIAASGMPPMLDLAGIVVAAVAARSAAMAFNRIVDLPFDARNPRTKNRELVTGELEVRYAIGFTVFHSALFVATSFWLAPICGWLSLPVLVLLLGYSLLKRYTLLCHFGLGLALACAPAGAWLAISKSFVPGWEVPLWIGVGVVLWVAGFDLLYSIQDLEFDRKEGLRSVPSKLGSSRTRALSGLCFFSAWLTWLGVGLQTSLAWPYFAGLAVMAALLMVEHWLVRGNRLEAIPVAFFQVNAWIGLVYFAALVAALH
ncbi:MAG: UbiA family prenyltransferase [Planctomycetes bacterium]|nr:UbiA family prenyltransferase [Planctomycetota bacterium]